MESATMLLEVHQIVGCASLDKSVCQQALSLQNKIDMLLKQFAAAYCS